ncbi:MAG TPA: hypothetical protein VGM88_25160 [Kofleriaceae bacterium]|jgi:hypothetical protein
MATNLRKWLSIAVALAGACALGVSVQAGHWWAYESFFIGPTGTEICSGGDCHPGSLMQIGGSEHWTRTGVAVWAGGLLTLLLLVIIASATAAGRKPRMLSKTAIVSVVATGLAGAWFYASFPGMAGADFAPARGLYLFAAGLVAGAVGAAMIWRRARR